MTYPRVLPGGGIIAGMMLIPRSLILSIAPPLSLLVVDGPEPSLKVCRRQRKYYTFVPLTSTCDSQKEMTAWARRLADVDDAIPIGVHANAVRWVRLPERPSPHRFVDCGIPRGIEIG